MNRLTTLANQLKHLARPVYFPAWKLYKRMTAKGRLSRSLRQANTVLVYQMGRVGSKSVATSLDAAGMNVLHSHFLSEGGRSWLAETVKRRREDPGPIHAEAVLKQCLDQGLFSRPVNVVTLVRDPVAQHMSAYFYTCVTHTDGVVREFDDEAVRADFLAGVGYPPDIPLQWFDREVRGVFGLDVFREPFPHNRGFAVYESKDIRLLCLRLEDVGRCAEEAFRELLGVEGFTVQKLNEAATLPQGHLYNRFIQAVSPPPSYIEKMYSSQLATHFYTPDELQRFKERWSRCEERAA